MIVQEIRISIAKKPYIFYDFSGGGGVGHPVPPILDPCMSYYEKLTLKRVRVDITSIRVNVNDNCCRYMVCHKHVTAWSVCLYSWTLVDFFLEA